MSKQTKKLVLQQLQNIEVAGVPSLEEELKSHLIRAQVPNEPDGYIHPSSISGCPRKIWFNMNLIPYSNWSPHDPELQMIFDVGHSVEIMMFKRYFRQMNMLVAEEKPIPENRDRVRGRADVVLWFKNEYYIIDIKTANDYSFSHNVPMKGYDMQVACYMIYLQIDRGKVLYINKNNCQLAETNIHIKDPIVQEVREKITKLNAYYTQGIVPDVANIRPKCTEKSCSYFLQCMKYPETEVSLH